MNGKTPSWLERRLDEPRLCGLELGTKEWFAAQREVIRSRPLLRACYDLWYRRLLEDARSVPASPGALLVELGSGGSYLKELAPDVITSDIIPGIAERVVRAESLPFCDGSVRALFLTHSFHHLPDVEAFLREARRVLVEGGVISMIEVAHTAFSRFFFDRFHPEPYTPTAPGWSLAQSNAMLDSNQALSWIVLFRDRARFQARFPTLHLEACEHLPWLSYLMAGGVTKRSLLPARAAPLVLGLERRLSGLSPWMALHWHLRIRKVTGPRTG